MSLDLVETLAQQDFAVADGFLGQPHCAALRAALDERRRAGEFSPARIVARGAEPQRLAAERGDAICWWPTVADDDRAALRASEQLFLARLEALREQLNRRFLLGIEAVELHYAAYPPGASYARHRDQPRGRDERVVSVVYYLNDNWHSGQGGELCLYLAAARNEVVLPLADRLVLFLSAALEHEVRAAARERLSVTGWLRRRALQASARIGAG